MTPNEEAPASPRRQAIGRTGATDTAQSVPGWATTRRAKTLVRFQGEYVTPESLHAQNALEAATDRLRVRVQPAVTPSHTQSSVGGTGRGTAHFDPSHPADRFPSDWTVDAETGEATSLPCRFLETTQPRATPKGLSGPHRKVATALSLNVAHLCQKYGIDRVGFLTLTFKDHVTEVREASRRFNSLASHVIRPRYAHYIRVLERQKSGRIHYHLLVVLADDIRTGADFDAFGKRDYKSANNHLRREWAFWRKTAGLYGFGRTELMPVRSDAGALGQYVGKYIGKHIGQREERDKGARLVSYAGDARMATSKHSTYSIRPDQWRAKVLTFVRIMSKAKPHARINSMDDLSFHLGKRWAYEWRDFIFDLPPSDLSIPF